MADQGRRQYYHRNMSSEIMGLIYGQHGSSSHELAPGGLSYEASFMPHGGACLAVRTTCPVC